MTKTSSAQATRIAVPYYGSLSVIPSRLTRVFFLVEVDLGKQSIGELTLKVWDPEKEPALSSWLRQMGTDGVICSDAYTQQKSALAAEGIWVESQQEGEVHEVVTRWMHTSCPENPKPAQPLPPLFRPPQKQAQALARRPEGSRVGRRETLQHLPSVSRPLAARSRDSVPLAAPLWGAPASPRSKRGQGGAKS